MEKASLFQMGQLLSRRNSGFTLLEMMMVLFVLSILFSISRLTFKPFEFNQFENEVLSTQLKSLATTSTNELNHPYPSNVSILTFNPWGNINSAQTVQAYKTYVFQLGTGRYVKK